MFSSFTFMTVVAFVGAMSDANNLSSGAPLACDSEYQLYRENVIFKAGQYELMGFGLTCQQCFARCAAKNYRFCQWNYAHSNRGCAGADADHVQPFAPSGQVAIYKKPVSWGAPSACDSEYQLYQDNVVFKHGQYELMGWGLTCDQCFARCAAKNYGFCQWNYGHSNRGCAGADADHVQPFAQPAQVAIYKKHVPNSCNPQYSLYRDSFHFKANTYELLGYGLTCDQCFTRCASKNYGFCQWNYGQRNRGCAGGKSLTIAKYPYAVVAIYKKQSNHAVAVHRRRGKRFGDGCRRAKESYRRVCTKIYHEYCNCYQNSKQYREQWLNACVKRAITITKCEFRKYIEAPIHAQPFRNQYKQCSSRCKY